MADPLHIISVPLWHHWTDVLGFASTQQEGSSWHSWPHMWSVKNWDNGMRRPAKVVAYHVWQYGTTRCQLTVCMVCRVAVESPGFSRHVSSNQHYNVFSGRCPSAKLSMDELRDQLWQTFSCEQNCKRYEVRFNHADGRVQTRLIGLHNAGHFQAPVAPPMSTGQVFLNMQPPETRATEPEARGFAPEAHSVGNPLDLISVPSWLEWTDVLGFASRQQEGSSWQSWPHMWSVKDWENGMQRPSKLVAYHVWHYGTTCCQLNSCMVCGVALESPGFSRHVSSNLHYNVFSGLCPPSAQSSIDALREQLWQTFSCEQNCKRYEVRFNHADGRVQTRLIGLHNAGHSQAPVAPPMSTGQVFLNVQPPETRATEPEARGFAPEAHSVGNPLDLISVPSWLEWTDVLGFASTQQEGSSWHSWPHMWSVKNWDNGMRRPAKVVAYHVWQHGATRCQLTVCMVCRVAVESPGFSRHVSSNKHYNVFSGRCPSAKLSMDELRQQLWQTFSCEQNCKRYEVRFNHADGRVQTRLIGLHNAGHFQAPVAPPMSAGHRISQARPPEARAAPEACAAKHSFLSALNVQSFASQCSRDLDHVALEPQNDDESWSTTAAPGCDLDTDGLWHV